MSDVPLPFDDTQELKERIAELEEQLEATSRERTSLNDRLMRMLTDARENSDRTYATARRVAWNDLLSERTEAYALDEVRRRIQPLEGVLYRISQLGERVSGKPMEDLKAAATLAEGEIRQASKTPASEVEYKRLRDEIKRLRSHIKASGHDLHEQHGPQEKDGLGCVCPGCLLIVGMDLHDLESA